MAILSFDSGGVHDYSIRLPHQPIQALFLNEHSFAIKERNLVEGPYGGSYYKTASSVLYKFYTNPHGEKYLRIFDTSSGRFYESGFLNVQGDPIIFKTSTKYCKEMIDAIDAHISKILGEPFAHYPANNVWSQNLSGRLTLPFEENGALGLFYPFLKNEENYDFFSNLKTLDVDDTKASSRSYSYYDRPFLELSMVGPRGLYGALRNSRDIEEFITRISYKSAIQSDEDVTFLIENPKFLRLFSKIDLKMGAKEAYDSGRAELFYNNHLYMSPGELYTFKYLLGAIPKTRRPEVWDLIDKLVRFRKERGFVEYMQMRKSGKIGSKDEYDPCEGSSAQEVELTLKGTPRSKEFISAFFDKVKEAYAENEEIFPSFDEKSLNDLAEKGFGRVKVPYMKVLDAHMNAYVSTVLITEGTDPVKQCVATAAELFGMDITEDEEFEVREASIKDEDGNDKFFIHFYDRSVKYSSTESLKKIIQGSPKAKNRNAELFKTRATSHIESHHNQLKSLTLVRDMEETLKQTAAEVDTHLVKLGRELTPANRLSFLRRSEFYRQYKINWWYFDLGVTDPDIDLFKKEKIKSKKAVAFWLNQKDKLSPKLYTSLIKAGISSQEEVDFWLESEDSLPEEMLNELLLTGMGKWDGSGAGNDFLLNGMVAKGAVPLPDDW